MDPTQLYQNIAQPPAQPAQPAQPPGGPQPAGFLDKLGGFLSHPAVQGLLGAYFGAVSSPRHGGFGTAIGRGGIGGLEMMDQATALRQQQQALSQKTAQQNQMIGLRGREVGAQELTAQTNAAAKTPIGKPAAMRILQTNPKIEIDVDTLAMFTPDLVRKELDAQRTTGQHAPEIAAHIAELQARTGQAQAETAAIPQRLGIESAGLGIREQGLAQQKQLGEERIGVERDAIAARGGQQKQDQQRNKSYADLYKAGLADYVKNHPQHLWGLVGGGTPEEATAYATNVATAGVAGLSGGAPSPTPPAPGAPAGGPGTAAAAETPVTFKTSQPDTPPGHAYHTPDGKAFVVKNGVATEVPSGG